MIGNLRLVAATALIILILPLTWAQERVSPPWVLYEEGMEHLSAHRYGEALRLFRAAAAARSPFPEADFGIGQVFQAEGAYDLALRHYQSAIHNSGFLEIAGTEYLIRYQKAEVFRLSGQIDRFEQELRDISARETDFSHSDFEQRREAYQTTLLSQGLDRLMVLYRLNDGFSHRAHRDLGVHLVETGKCHDALPHLTFAAMKGLSTLTAEIRRETFDYTYQTAGLLIADSLDQRHLRSYIEREELFRTLYHLALAMDCVSPGSDPALAIWRTLASEPEAGEWHRRSLQRIPGPLLRRR